MWNTLGFKSSVRFRIPINNGIIVDLGQHAGTHISYIVLNLLG